MYSATLERIEGGKPGLLAKIRKIRKLVEKAKRDPNFRARVVALIHDLPEKDHDAEIERLVEYARQGIRYVRDPWAPKGLELFIDPRTMLRDVERGVAQGDCDDHVLLASALLEVAGYPTRYVVGGTAPGAYRHIWLEVGHPKQGWLPVEMTKKDWPVGRDPSGKFAVVETHLGDFGDGDDVNGLGQYRTGLSRSALRRRLAAPVGRQRTRARRRRRWRPRRGRGVRRITSSLEPRRLGRRDIRARSWEQRRARRGRGRWGTFHGLGDLEAVEVPPSFYNVQEDTQLYAGATPSDFFRATEIRSMGQEHTALRYSPLLGSLGLEDYLEDWDDASADDGWGHVWQEDELGGFFKKLVRLPKKVATKTRRRAKRTAGSLRRRSKRLAKSVAASRAGRGLKRGVQKYGPEVLAVAGTIVAGPAAGAALYGATNAVRQDYLARKAAARGDIPPRIIYDQIPIAIANEPDVEPVTPPIVSVQPRALPRGPSIPSSFMSDVPGPSFVAATEGFALPWDVPDQVAVEDQGQGGVDADREWLAPLPGAGIGSWIPTPPLDEFPNAPAIDPFDTPADDVDGGDFFPGFGMGYGSSPWSSVESQIDSAHTFGLGDDDMENSALQLGFGTLGAESWITQLARAAGQTAIAYGQSRLGKRYGKIPIPPPVTAFLAPPMAPPTPPAPRVAARLHAFGGKPPGGFKITPGLAIAGAGLLAMMMMRR